MVMRLDEKLQVSPISSEKNTGNDGDLVQYNRDFRVNITPMTVRRVRSSVRVRTISHVKKLLVLMHVAKSC